MDNMTVALGPDTDVAVGDEVVLIGAQGGERILAEEVARRLGHDQLRGHDRPAAARGARAQGDDPVVDGGRRAARRAARAARSPTSTSPWTATRRRPRASWPGRCAGRCSGSRRRSAPGGWWTVARAASTTSRRSRARRSRRTSRKRDFTINAMARPVGRRGADRSAGWTGGHRVAASSASSARSAYESDPLRPLRLARFAAELGFAPDPETERLTAEAAASRVPEASGERVFAELRRLVLAPRRRRGARAGRSARPAPRGPARARRPARRRAEPLSPQGRLRAHARGARAPDRARARGDRRARARSWTSRWPTSSRAAQALRFGALLHDIGKPATHGVREDGRVTFIGPRPAGRGDGAPGVPAPAHERAAAAGSSQAVTRHHLVLGFLVHERPLDRRAVYRYLTRTEPVEVEVTLLSCADRLATRGKNAERGHRRPPRARAGADARRARVAALRPAAAARSAATSWRARRASSRGPSSGASWASCGRPRTPARSRIATKRSSSPGGCATMPSRDRRLRDLRGRRPARRQGRARARLRAAPRAGPVRLDRPVRADRARSSTRCQREFDLHPLAVEDAIHAHQRPEARGLRRDGLHGAEDGALRGPDGGRSSSARCSSSSATDFVITVRHGEASSLHGRAARRSRRDPERLQARAERGAARDPGHVVDDYQPAIDGLEQRHRRGRGAALLGRARQPGGAHLQAPARGAQLPAAPPRRSSSRSTGSPAGTTCMIHRRGARLLPRRERPPDPRRASSSTASATCCPASSQANLAQVGVRQNEDMRKISAWVAIAAVPDRDRRHLRHELPAHAGAALGRSAIPAAIAADAHDLRVPVPTASSGRAGCRLPGHARRLHLLQDRRRRAAGRDRPGGRAHDRVHGHQPVDARARARDPAQPLAQPLRRARRGPRAHGHGGQAAGDPHARHARLRRHQPPELVRGRPLGRPSSTCTST